MKTIDHFWKKSLVLLIEFDMMYGEIVMEK